MPERLTDHLVEVGVLDPAQAEAALDRQVLQGGALDTSLLELGLLDEEALIEGLRAAYDAPAAELSQILAPPDPRALRMFPEPWAKRHNLAPLRLSADGASLEVLSPSPPDGALLSRLGELLDMALLPVLAPEFRVWQRLARLYELEPPERFRELISTIGAEPDPDPTEARAAVSASPSAPPPPPPSSTPDDEALGFSQAVNLLRDAKHRDEIVQIALRYAHRELAFVGMFVNHEDHLEGWMGAGPGAERIPQMKVDLTPDSAFRVVLDTQAHYLGPVPSDPGHAELLTRLGRDTPRGVLIVPVRIRNRTVALLYGENGGETIPPRLAADLMLFTTHLQMALEGLLMRRKAESLSELRKVDARTAPPAADPPPPVAPAPELAEAVAEIPPPEEDFDPSLDLTELKLDEEAGEVDEDPSTGPLEVPEPASERPTVRDDEIDDDDVDALQREMLGAQGDLDPADPTDATARPAGAEPTPETSPEPEPVDAAALSARPEIAREPDDDDFEPVAAPTLPLIERPDAWAHATQLPEESEDVTDGHPLLADDGGEAGWTDVEPPDLGAELDASISAAKDALETANGSGVFDRDALASTKGGQRLLEELDELTSSLEQALAQSEASSAVDPTAPDPEGDRAASEAPTPVELTAPTPGPGPEEGGWEDVDVDDWGTPRPQLDVLDAPTPVDEAAARASLSEDTTLPESNAAATARASLTEDATLPDLSAEAWIRASSEVVRPRPVPPEVMEAAARPEEPERVPLTRITIGRQEAPQLFEIHSGREGDHRSEPSPAATSIDGTVPILLGQAAEDPIPLTDADRRADDEPVPLTQRSTGGYAAEAPYDDVSPYEGSDGLEAELSAPPASAESLRPMPAPTLPISHDQVHAGRLEQEAKRWREQLEHGDAAAQAAAASALVALGPETLPYLGEHFPGPLNLDPFSPDANLPPFAKCGPLLSALERFGRDAHGVVIRRLDAPSPLHRFFATYFYGAVYVPEAIPRLIQRLHDEEPRICMLAARTLFSYREHPDFSAVLDHLHGRLSASSSMARRHACYLLGLFRDVTVIPTLIEVLGKKDKAMTDVVEDALAEITKQRLGTSPKKWSAWWSKNKDRSRLAWLVDGLAAKDADLRRSAAEELRAVTGLDMGFDENAPKRQREEARQRWIAWWREQEGSLDLS